MKTLLAITLCLATIPAQAESWPTRSTLICSGNGRSFTISYDIDAGVAYVDLRGPPRPNSPYRAGQYVGTVTKSGLDLKFEGVINNQKWQEIVDPALTVHETNAHYLCHQVQPEAVS
jgi:hypothetical protein